MASIRDLLTQMPTEFTNAPAEPTHKTINIGNWYRLIPFEVNKYDGYTGSVISARNFLQSLPARNSVLNSRIDALVSHLLSREVNYSPSQLENVVNEIAREHIIANRMYIEGVNKTVADHCEDHRKMMNDAILMAEQKAAAFNAANACGQQIQAPVKAKASSLATMFSRSKLLLLLTK